MPFTIPPATAIAGQAGFVSDINNNYASLAAVATDNVQNAKYSGGADPTGAADSTAAIQAALNAGGMVYVPAGTYKVTASLTLPSGVTLAGDGISSVINAASPLTGSVIKLASTSTRQTMVRDLLVKVNSLTSVDGIAYDNTGLSGSTPAAHRLWNVTVNDAGRDGFHYGNGVLEHFTGFCFAFNAGRSGFYSDSGCTDSRWVSCTSGQSLQHGFVIAASSNHLFAACKAYYAGSAFTSGSGSGYYIGNSPSITFAGCEAQDCCDNGWRWDTGCSNSMMTGCVVDACNAGASPAGNALSAGISANALTNSAFVGNEIANRAGGAGTMQQSIAFTGACTGLACVANATSIGYLHVAGSSIGVSNAPGGVDISKAGAGLAVAEGSNAKQGTLTMNGTTAVVVSNTSVTANSRIFLTYQLGAGTVGAPYVSARTAGTSFTVKSTVASDTSTCAYFITEPG